MRPVIADFWERAPNFDLFGYGVAGAGNIVKLLKLAEDVGMRAGAIYDGNRPDCALLARRHFPLSLIEELPTPDIRDKHVLDPATGKETDSIEKPGLFTRHGKLKQEFRPYLDGLLARLDQYFTAGAGADVGRGFA